MGTVAPHPTPSSPAASATWRSPPAARAGAPTRRTRSRHSSRACAPRWRGSRSTCTCVTGLGFVAGLGPLPPTVHDRPPRLRDIVALVVAVPGPDHRGAAPRWHGSADMGATEELARLVAPAAKRIVVTVRADWNLRRLRAVAPDLRVGFAPGMYLGRDPDRLAPRLVDAIRLVPGAREVHLRLETFEAMLDEGVIDAALIHQPRHEAERREPSTRRRRAGASGSRGRSTRAPT